MRTDHPHARLRRALNALRLVYRQLPDDRLVLVDPATTATVFVGTATEALAYIERGTTTDG